ncbi:MAG: hypothetical protein IJ583_01830, partial [Firmicutes bacterium]|nr:hypothetical protein [Bacillota bacterium]
MQNNSKQKTAVHAAVFLFFNFDIFRHFAGSLLTPSKAALFGFAAAADKMPHFRISDITAFLHIRICVNMFSDILKQHFLVSLRTDT